MPARSDKVESTTAIVDGGFAIGASQATIGSRLIAIGSTEIIVVRRVIAPRPTEITIGRDGIGIGSTEIATSTIDVA